MNINQIEFIVDDIKEISGINKKVKGGKKTFYARIKSSASLAMKEKEIFVYSLLQWIVIGLAYLLFSEIFRIIPPETWELIERGSFENKYTPIDERLHPGEQAEVFLAGIKFLLWSVMCVGIAAYPIGTLTGCIGATHLLSRQGKQATIFKTWKMVSPHAVLLWEFHWLDGWITAKRIKTRITNATNANGNTYYGEAWYYAWKLGVAGMLPGIIRGGDIRQSARNSVGFIKENFIEVAKIRAGYSAVCWVVGISGWFAAGAGIIYGGFIKPETNIYDFYLFVAVPLLGSLFIVMMFLRPIYVISICDLYADWKKEEDEEIRLKRARLKDKYKKKETIGMMR